MNNVCNQVSNGSETIIVRKKEKKERGKEAGREGGSGERSRIKRRR